MSINLMAAIFRTDFRDLQDGEGNTTKASTAKFVCIALADHANDEGEGAYPSISKVAYKTNLSRTAVINTLDALKYNGILTPNGTSKWDTINYTINKSCFSLDSQPALLVNPVDQPSQPTIPPPVNPVDPNHPLTIIKTTTTAENIFKIYQDNIALIVPKTREILLNIEKDYPDGWFADATLEAVKNNKRNLGYIEAILKRWKADGRGNKKPVKQQPQGRSNPQTLTRNL